MHDIKAIRADPAAFDAGLARRRVKSVGFAIAALKQREIDAQQSNDDLIARQRAIGERVATLGRQTAGTGWVDDAHSALVQERGELLAELGRLKAALADGSDLPDRLAKEIEAQLTTLPNLAAPDVPDGLDESGNVVVASHGTPPTFDFTPKEHDALALRFGYDPDAAAAIAGARFAVLKGPLARLHRALGQFMLDRAVASGWTEVAPPLLVRREAMFGTGQLPKFADDAFQTTDDRFLIPTSEVSLTNLIRGRVLDAAELPLRFTALTPCFRAEAGSAGRDTRGLIRQHQFDKVEIVGIVADVEAAASEHERMTAHAEGILTALNLPFRRVLLCAGDMGFAARKTFDLEVWLPGQGAYREISSVSDCGDFQARRMDVDEPKGGRFKVRGQKGTSFVHTLNGSALAVGRTLVAVLENHQRADGSVAVPEVLWPYMSGMTELVPG